MTVPVEYALIGDLHFQDLGEGMQVARAAFKNGQKVVVVRSASGYDVTWSNHGFEDAKPNVNTVISLNLHQANIQLREIAEL